MNTLKQNAILIVATCLPVAILVSLLVRIDGEPGMAATPLSIESVPRNLVYESDTERTTDNSGTALPSRELVDHGLAIVGTAIPAIETAHAVDRFNGAPVRVTSITQSNDRQLPVQWRVHARGYRPERFSSDEIIRSLDEPLKLTARDWARVTVRHESPVASVPLAWSVLTMHTSPGVNEEPRSLRHYCDSENGQALVHLDQAGEIFVDTRSLVHGPFQIAPGGSFTIVLPSPELLDRARSIQFLEDDGEPASIDLTAIQRLPAGGDYAQDLSTNSEGCVEVPALGDSLLIRLRGGRKILSAHDGYEDTLVAEMGRNLWSVQFPANDRRLRVHLRNEGLLVGLFNSRDGSPIHGSGVIAVSRTIDGERIHPETWSLEIADGQTAIPHAARAQLAKEPFSTAALLVPGFESKAVSLASLGTQRRTRIGLEPAASRSFQLVWNDGSPTGLPCSVFDLDADEKVGEGTRPSFPWSGSDLVVVSTITHSNIKMSAEDIAGSEHLDVKIGYGKCTVTISGVPSGVSEVAVLPVNRYATGRPEEASLYRWLADGVEESDRSVSLDLPPGEYVFGTPDEVRIQLRRAQRVQPVQRFSVSDEGQMRVEWTDHFAIVDSPISGRISGGADWSGLLEIVPIYNYSTSSVPGSFHCARVLIDSNGQYTIPTGERLPRSLMIIARLSTHGEASTLVPLKKILPGESAHLSSNHLRIQRVGDTFETGGVKLRIWTKPGSDSHNNEEGARNQLTFFWAGMDEMTIPFIGDDVERAFANRHRGQSHVMPTELVRGEGGTLLKVGDTLD